MATVKIDIKDLDRYARKLRDGFPKALDAALMSAALRCLPALQDATRTAPPANPRGIGQGGAVNTGNYLRSWKVQPAGRGAVLVYNQASYAGVIEWGRRPGRKMPPPGTLARWIQRRLGKSRAESLRLAFVFARAIARRGLKPRLVMTNLLSALQTLVRDEIDRELQVRVAKLTGGK